MYYDIYDTPEGKIAVLFNEFRTKSDEYTVASLFRRDGVIYFAQLIGSNSPKSYFCNHEVIKAKLDSKNNLYSVYNKDAFKYSFPFPERSCKVIVAPTKAAAWDTLIKLVGFDGKPIDEYFTTSFVKDEGQTKRIALFVSQKYSDKRQIADGTDLLTQFEAIDRAPVLFKGGEIGDFATE